MCSTPIASTCSYTPGRHGLLRLVKSGGAAGAGVLDADDRDPDDAKAMQRALGDTHLAVDGSDEDRFDRVETGVVERLERRLPDKRAR